MSDFVGKMKGLGAQLTGIGVQTGQVPGVVSTVPQMTYNSQGGVTSYGGVTITGATTSMSSSVLASIAQATQMYNAASKAGDTAGMTAAHNQAEAARATAGLTGGTTGGTLSKLAVGSDSAKGGLTLVGEEGPEFRYLEQGTKILPSNISRNLLALPANLNTMIASLVGKDNSTTSSSTDNGVSIYGNITVQTNDARGFVNNLKRLGR
jgi:hypothetical protein